MSRRSSVMKRHPIVASFVLTYAISWGSCRSRPSSSWRPDRSSPPGRTRRRPPAICRRDERRGGRFGRHRPEGPGAARTRAGDDETLDLTTLHVADACMRVGIPVRCAPAGTRPLWSGTHLVGRVCPARHYGSVDIFLEAIEGSDPGDVLVIDNSGRLDEACVGDLVTLEASRAGLSGIVIWGLHRDTTGFKSSGCLYSAWEHCRLVHNALIHRTRLLRLRPPAASTSSPATTSSWETTTVSCLWV